MRLSLPMVERLAAQMGRLVVLTATDAAQYPPLAASLKTRPFVITMSSGDDKWPSLHLLQRIVQRQASMRRRPSR